MEADTLLNKASLKVDEFRKTLGQESYEMAQGWLEMYASVLHLSQRSFGFNHRISFQSSKAFKAGLEDKNVLGSYKQAQEYHRKAKETYEAIMVSKRCIGFARWVTELIFVP